MMVDPIDAQDPIIATINGEKGGEGYVAGVGGNSTQIGETSDPPGRPNRAINR